MKIAVPLAAGKLAMHFGHCEQFALILVDEIKKKIVSKELITPPPHEPGVLPQWLREKGANVIIAGGMGQRAQNLFANAEITVLVGAPSEDAETLVMKYIEGKLIPGTNLCDH